MPRRKRHGSKLAEERRGTGYCGWYSEPSEAVHTASDQELASSRRSASTTEHAPSPGGVSGFDAGGGAAQPTGRNRGAPCGSRCSRARASTAGRRRAGRAAPAELWMPEPAAALAGRLAGAQRRTQTALPGRGHRSAAGSLAAPPAAPRSSARQIRRLTHPGSTGGATRAQS
eukprot:scaffold42764_cov50-Phaeocystis_antarctica.AAC.2